MAETDHGQHSAVAVSLPADDSSTSNGTGSGGEPLFVVEASTGWSPLHLGTLWQYRELLYFLVWRDIKARYKQTLLGAAWAVLQPVLTMIVFSLFFGKLGNIPSDDFPYPVWTFTALLPWQLFAYALSESGNSLVTNKELLTKIYFPRLLIPMSAVVAGLVDFGIAFVVLIGLMAYYGIAITPAVLALPAFIVLAALTALAAGLWLAALNARFRDVRYTLPFISQFWLFATPIAYPISLIPEAWRPVYALNPMVGVVEGFRWAILGKTDALNLSMLVSVIVMILLLVGGLYFFRRMERTIADVI